MFLRVREVASVFRAAFGNPTLRRVGFAYALFGMAEFGIWITLLVFAYGHGGATGSMTMVLAQLVPSMAVGPFIGAFADRRRPSRVLCAGYGLQAASMAIVALAIGLDAPVVLVFLAAPLTSLSMTVTRPAQAALLPAIVRTPQELTAANVMTGWTDGAGSLLGPAAVGLLLGGHVIAPGSASGPAAAVTAMALLTLLSTLLVARLVGPAAAVGPDDVSEASEDEQRADGSAGRRLSVLWRAVASIRTGALANLSGAIADSQIRVLLTLHAFYFMLVGALDFLCVILAVNVLHMGQGGAGFLNAALGGGALLAGFVTAFLVGRRHLSTTLTVAILVAVTALALVDAIPEVAPAIVLIATVGLAGAVFDVTGRTLLQRSAPPDALAGSFSILEALMDFGLASGAVLVRVAIAIDGYRAALFAPAVVALVLVAVLWRRLRTIDASATIPQVEIQLLRGLPIFAALPAPALESVARQLEPVTVPPGTVVINEGEDGDSYYVVADGKLRISRHGQTLQAVSRGDGFGEIALIRDVPRQATVTATCPALLYSLQKEPFVTAVTGHSSATRATERIIAKHMDGTETEPDTPED